MAKYVIVAGGVISGTGKGVSAASLGLLLKLRGHTVTIIKFDPYLNVNAGILAPREHGECFLCDDFKTFMEISPKEIVVQAASRQKYIDQSQSLNLMIHPATPIKDVNALIIEAWRLGVKSLYYQISINAAQAFSRNIMSCVNCES